MTQQTARGARSLARRPLAVGLAAGVLGVLAMALLDAPSEGEAQDHSAARPVAAGPSPGLAARAALGPPAAHSGEIRTGAAAPQDATAAETAEAAYREAYAPGLLMLRPAPSVSLAQVAGQLGGAVHRSVGPSGFGAVVLPEGVSALEAIQELRRWELVAEVAPTGRIRAAGNATVPEAQTTRNAAEQAVWDGHAAVEAAVAEIEEAQAALGVAEADFQAADAEWQAADDADEPKSVVEALKSVRNDKKALRDDAEDALEDAEHALESAQEDLEEAQEELSDAEEELVDALERAEKDRLHALRKIQWFLKKAGHPRWERGEDEWDVYVEPSYAEWVVAVLDTGVAYRTADGHQQAPTLAQSAFVHPYDFVNDDAFPDDDHQHGTHLASIIASQGDVVGMAAGATIMPVKVLGADNAGIEIDLINGIHHAIDNGAHVINLSLSFRPGYVPSGPLLSALERAHSEGVIVVGASGNDGVTGVTWPAAYREVIAVTSSAVNGKGNSVERAEYSNASALVDITAPGGANGDDLNEDGVTDGILGETIALQQPGELGYYFYAGTSQAAALVSAAVVHLLEAGATPEQVKLAMQHEARADMGDRYEDGGGAGSVDLRDAIEAIEDGDTKVQTARNFHVSLMPYLQSKEGGKKVQPRAKISVVGGDGLPVKEVEVFGEVMGAVQMPFSCHTNGAGVCTVSLDDIDLRDDNDVVQDLPLSFMWRVDTVAKDNIGEHPGAALYATDRVELMHAAAQADPQTSGGLLALRWGAVDDEELGELHESFLIMDAGTGLASSPLGLIFTPAAIADIATVQEVSVDLDGTGLASSPLGFAPMWTLTFDGTGLASSPLGLMADGQLRFVAFDGTGLASSPLGFSGRELFLPASEFDGTGLASSPLGFSSNPMLFQPGLLLGSGLETTSLATTMGTGGWVTDQGYPGATVMGAAGMVASELVASGNSVVAGTGALDSAPLLSGDLDRAIDILQAEAELAATDPGL